MIDNISKSHKKEKSLLELIYIIYKGKWIIISIIIASVILAFTYNQLTTPIYESKALLKKEVTDNSGQRDELYEIVKLQTSDRLETEMELVKTSEVLGRVIRDLKLRFDVKKIVDPKGNSYHLKNVFVDFPDSGNNYAKEISFSLPKIKYLKIKDENTELELFIKKIATNKFELWDVEKNKLIISFNVSSVSKSDSLIESNIENSFDLKQELQKNQNQLNVNTDFLQFDFSWDDAPVGSKIYFDIENYSKFYTTFSKDINVSRIGHTDVFELSIKSSSPLACKIIADDLINQFREVRMEQQKQSVRY